MIVYDTETFNTDRATPYAKFLYRLSKISGEFYCNITDRELEKCKKFVLFSKEQVVLTKC